MALLCTNMESKCLVADQQVASMLGAPLAYCEVTPPLARGDSELSASATPPTAAQPTLDVVHAHVPAVDLQHAVLEQTPLTEDEEDPEGDADGVEAHPYVKAPADDEQGVVLAAFQGQDASVTETADLVEALGALVLDQEEEEAAAEAEAPETTEAGVDGVLQGVEQEEEAEEEEEEEAEVTPPESVEDADYRIQVNHALALQYIATAPRKTRLLVPRAPLQQSTLRALPLTSCAPHNRRFLRS
jgi:hypothetical protein